MRWVLKTADSATVEKLSAELSAHPSLGLKNPQLVATLARLLVMRGISEGEGAEHFLVPTLSHLHSPYLMTGTTTTSACWSCPKTSAAFPSTSPGRTTKSNLDPNLR